MRSIVMILVYTSLILTVSVFLDGCSDMSKQPSGDDTILQDVVLDNEVLKRTSDTDVLDVTDSAHAEVNDVIEEVVD